MKDRDLWLVEEFTTVSNSWRSLVKFELALVAIIVILTVGSCCIHI